jgi:hypothetical protein
MSCDREITFWRFKMRKSVLLLMLGILISIQATAATVAYWRFENGTAGTDMTHGAASGVWAADVVDTSGNGNALSVWSTGGGAGYAYRTNVAASPIPRTGAVNNLSVKNTGGGPAMWTNSTAMRTMSPAVWTIEVSIKLENGGYRTIVGRDSSGTVTGDAALAALYLQAMPNNVLAIKFCDVTGVWHQAVSASNVFQGYNWGTDPEGNLATWYNIAAVSDGTLLSLYIDDVAAGTGYQLIAQNNMTGTSTNTALTAGAGSGGDWTAGNWSVGRGLYNGGHADRAYGYIDEVRISNAVLGLSEFLFYRTPSTGVVITPLDLTLNEEGSTGGDISFSLQYAPSTNVILTIAEQAGRGRVTLNRTVLTFTTSNWNIPQSIHVTAVDDTALGNAQQKILLAVTVSSVLDKNYDGFAVAPVVVTVLENECGAWGYAVSDFNLDCQVNMLDMATFAAYWLNCSFPDQAGCTDYLNGI